jgi:hypothetical protein
LLFCDFDATVSTLQTNLFPKFLAVTESKKTEQKEKKNKKFWDDFLDDRAIATVNVLCFMSIP